MVGQASKSTPALASPAYTASAAKVEKRHVELDRLERRLDALHAVRPAQVRG